MDLNRWVRIVYETTLKSSLKARLNLVANLPGFHAFNSGALTSKVLLLREISIRENLSASNLLSISSAILRMIAARRMMVISLRLRFGRYRFMLKVSSTFILIAADIRLMSRCENPPSSPCSMMLAACRYRS